MDRPDIEMIKLTHEVGALTYSCAPGVRQLVAYAEHLEEEAKNTKDILAHALAERRQWQEIATLERTDLRRILAGSDPSGWPGAAAHDAKVGKS